MAIRQYHVYVCVCVDSEREETAKKAHGRFSQKTMLHIVGIYVCVWARINSMRVRMCVLSYK